MPLSVTNHREIQQLLIQALQGHAGGLVGLNQELKRTIGVDDRIEDLCIRKLIFRNGDQYRHALFYRSFSDPAAYASSILSEPIRIQRKVSFVSSPLEPSPLAFGLFHYHRQKREIVELHYLFEGAVASTASIEYHYRRVPDREEAIIRLAGQILGIPFSSEADVETLAKTLYWLNLPIEKLPLKKGLKQDTIVALKAAGIFVVGQLLQQSNEKLKEILSANGYNHLQWFLRYQHLKTELSIPGWNKRFQIAA